MIKPRMKTIRVGSTDVYVWGVITEDNGEDLSAITPELRTVSPAGVASSWAAPVITEHPSLPVIRCAIQHDATSDGVGWWRLEAKLTDNPEVEVLLLGGYQVVA